MNVLHVCANPKPTEESVSKQMASAFFSTLVEKNPDVEMNNVDLYQDPPPYFSYEAFRALFYPAFKPEYEMTKEEEQAIDYATAQAEAFNSADVVVLTMPMWNFGTPGILKAWMDQVICPGLTFSLEASGPRPLHNVKKLVMLVASGGVYKEDDPRDALTADVKSAFSFIGLEDVEIAWADGQDTRFFSNSEQRKQWAIDAAIEIAEDIAEMDV